MLQHYLHAATTDFIHLVQMFCDSTGLGVHELLRDYCAKAMGSDRNKQYKEMIPG